MFSMYYPRTTRYKAKTICVVLIAFLSIGLSACANSTNSNKVTDDRSSQTTVPQGTSQAFRFGVPVDSRANALIAAEAGLRTGFEYTEPLTVVRAEQISYGEYIKLGGSDDRPSDMKIWLIVYFDDKWQSKPPRPNVTPSPPFRGCVDIAINADDGSLLEVGGPLQAGVMTECDK
jgi:hypothetical protein